MVQAEAVVGSMAEKEKVVKEVVGSVAAKEKVLVKEALGLAAAKEKVVKEVVGSAAAKEKVVVAEAVVALVAKEKVVEARAAAGSVAAGSMAAYMRHKGRSCYHLQAVKKHGWQELAEGKLNRHCSQFQPSDDRQQRQESSSAILAVA